MADERSGEGERRVANENLVKEYVVLDKDHRHVCGGKYVEEIGAFSLETDMYNENDGSRVNFGNYTNFPGFGVVDIQSLPDFGTKAQIRPEKIEMLSKLKEFASVDGKYLLRELDERDKKRYRQIFDWMRQCRRIAVENAVSEYKEGLVKMISEGA